MSSREAHGFLHLSTKRSGPRTLLLLHGTGGADVTAAWSDAGHRFGEEELEDARNWLSKR
ncbi:MAG: hypothetical protein R6V29_14855 [Spirochaetia bacterium]